MSFHGSSTAKLRWIVAVWILGLVVLSLQPFRFAATTGGTLAHVVAHVLAFGVPAFLLLRARLASVFVLALGLFALAAAIEFGQSVIYRHPFEGADLVADSLGVLLATLFYLVRQSRR